MILTDEQKLKLLKPLAKMKIGKIKYTMDNFEKYWFLLSKLGLNQDPEIEYNQDVRGFLMSQFHKDKWHYDLTRGERQSLSYKCNRIEENGRRVLRRFRRELEPKCVWEVKLENNWGKSIGTVISTSDHHDAYTIASMMYPAEKKVAVDFIRPCFNMQSFLNSQNTIQRKLNSRIDRVDVRIKELEDEKNQLRQQLATLITNTMCFTSDDS